MAVDNSKIVYGGDLMLFIGTGTTKTPLAFSTSAKLSVSTKVRDISSKDSGVWTDKTSGKFDWNASTDGLLNFGATSGTTGIDTVYGYFVSGTPINVVFGSKTGTSPNWTVNATAKSFNGTAIITGIDVNGNDGDNATYSITLDGVGPLTIV